MVLFTCFHCNANFSRKFNLERHIARSHSAHDNVSKRGKAKVNSWVCVLCTNATSTFTFYTSYEQHLIKAHSVSMNVSNLCFKSEDDFIGWKEDTEKSTVASYVSNTRPYKNKNDDVITYYKCNRRGANRGKNENRKRMLPSKGYSKSGFICPAQIIKRCSPNGMIDVRYQSTHIGHEMKFCFLRLPKSQEKLIASKIEEGVSLNHLMDEHRDEVTNSPSKEKKHLNKKKLYNIMRKYNIEAGGKQQHSNDQIGVLLQAAEKLDCNPNLSESYDEIDTPMNESTCQPLNDDETRDRDTNQIVHTIEQVVLKLKDSDDNLKEEFVKKYGQCANEMLKMLCGKENVIRNKDPVDRVITPKLRYFLRESDQLSVMVVEQR